MAFSINVVPPLILLQNFLTEKKTFVSFGRVRLDVSGHPYNPCIICYYYCYVIHVVV